MSIFSKLVYRLNVIPIKIPVGFLEGGENQQTDSEMCTKCRNSKENSWKRQNWNTYSADIICTVALLQERVWNWHKDGLKPTEQKRVRKLYILLTTYGLFIHDIWWHWDCGEKECFSDNSAGLTGYHLDPV